MRKPLRTKSECNRRSMPWRLGVSTVAVTIAVGYLLFLGQPVANAAFAEQPTSGASASPSDKPVAGSAAAAKPKPAVTVPAVAAPPARVECQCCQPTKCRARLHHFRRCRP
jgi:hypothetical protein